MDFKTFLKENNWSIIFVVVITLILFVFLLPEKDKGDVLAKNNQPAQKKVIDYKPILDDIEAKSFYVYDVTENKTIFSKDEHLKLPLASITKLMSGLVALDVMPETIIVTITREDIAMEGDNGLIVGEKWKLKDLLDFTLMESSNDGMHAITSTINYYESVNNEDVMKMMNKKAVALGLNDTVFINETGLDVDDYMSGAYSSSYDASMLFVEIIKNNPSLISSTNRQNEVFVSESGIKHIAENTNILIDKISGLIASKTGFTNLAGGNLAIVFDAGFMHPVVAVVLGSTTDGRFSDILKLVKITLEKLSE